MLFDGKSSKGAHQSYVSYTSSHPFAAKLRKVLEGYFARYPANRADDLRHRFRSDFDAALFELVLHECFLRLGCTINVPDLQDGREKPDFDVTFPSGESVLIAATLSSGTSKEAQAHDNRLEQFYKSLRTIKSPLLYIIPRINRFAKVPPSAKPLCEFIKEQIAPLTEADVDAVSALGRYFQWIYEEDDFVLELQGVPKAPESRNLDWSVDVNGPYETLWGYNPDPLRDAVADKASRYGVPSKPYVVAVNHTGTFPIDAEGIKQALYRSVEPSYRSIWKNGQNIGVSGVITARLWPASLHDARLALYACPQPMFACDHLPWQIPVGQYTHGTVHMKEGVTSGQLLELSPNWADATSGRGVSRNWGTKDG